VFFKERRRERKREEEEGEGEALASPFTRVFKTDYPCDLQDS
jgi:hypothetical protein